MRNKSGQVTIFIVAGILIVAIVLLFFFLNSKEDEPPQGTTSPESILETCLKQDVYDAVDLISMQGGYAKIPQLNVSYKFDNEQPSKIAYLCYTSGEENCIPTYGLIFTHMKEEISTQIEDMVHDCFTSIGQELDSQGFTVDATYNGFEFDIEYKKLIVKIKGEMTTTKADKTITKKDIEVEFPSGLYEILVFPVQDIINAEAYFEDCYFDHVLYETLIHPGLDVNKEQLSSGPRIYTITDEQTKERYRFAVRSCVRGAGW